jgi:NADP-dependent 3-hydroxy acid dehydrogenase YdfG
VAIVTGAAGGIGRAMTSGLLAAGIQVATVDRDREPLEALAATAREQGKATELLTIQADLTNDSAVDEITKATRTRYGRIDILVNNAGSARAQTDQTAGSAPSSSGKSRPISGAASSRCTRRHHGRWRTLSCPK